MVPQRRSITVAQTEIETAPAQPFPPQKKSALGFALRPLKPCCTVVGDKGCILASHPNKLNHRLQGDLEAGVAKMTGS
jgi:hypothetical protein